MRAARIENGVVADLWEVPSLDCYGSEVFLVEAPEDVKIGATYDVDGFTNPPAERNVQAEIDALERSQLMPRATREFMLLSMEAQFTPTQLAKNPGYQAVKAFDNQIVALRALL